MQIPIVIITCGPQVWQIPGLREKLTNADFNDFLPLTKFMAKMDEYLVDFKKEVTVFMIFLSLFRANPRYTVDNILSSM